MLTCRLSHYWPRIICVCWLAMSTSLHVSNPTFAGYDPPGGEPPPGRTATTGMSRIYQ